MNKKSAAAVIFSIFILGSMMMFQFIRFNDGRLHVVFCDVGQGDGIFIRSSSGKNFVVDAGPNDKIVDCIERHTPFWDRTISFAILTHPHADHFTGFKSILEKYKVLRFAGENLDNDSKGYVNLKKLLKDNGLDIENLFAGDILRVDDGLKILVLGPDSEFLRRVSPQGLINQSSEQATLITYFTFGNFDALLAGDAESSQLSENIDSFDIKNIEVLKVPHHGSKTGLTDEILRSLNPKFAVISVGKSNKYGHPTTLILDLLDNAEIKIFRTDKDGEIEFVSDGQSYGKVN